MATSKQMLGLLKSHVEGDDARFFDLVLQVADSAQLKGHTRLAEQLREWVDVGRQPNGLGNEPTPIARPPGELGTILGTAYSSIRLNHLVLPVRIADELQQLVAEFENRDTLEEKGLQPRQRVLLTGPPGTGKTMSASALAGELGYPLHTVLLHGLISKFMGETAAKLKLIFDVVKSQRGVYLFDEIDALAAARGMGNDVGEARRILNSFLQFLDEDTGPSMVVATTNLPEILDRAILRRFDLVLQYNLPDRFAIQQAMSCKLIGFEIAGIEWSEVLGEAMGLSTSDVIQAAADAARRVVLSRTNGTAVSTHDLVAALARRKRFQNLGVKNDGTKSAPLGTQ